MIIDLHAHTKPWSDDSNLDATELIRRAKQAGLDGICLTEHDWFWDSEAVARLSEENDFLVLPGVEINTEEAHFLVFGLEQYNFGMWRVETLRSFVDDVGGVMIMAHPYRRRLYMDDNVPAAVERYYQRPFFKLIDAIEVLNGKATARQNEFSQELCRRLNLKGIGGSDAHVAADIPSSATLFERRIGSVAELIAEIKAGRFRPIDLRQPTSPP
ncbi:MAG: PHP domain-containing protein [Dehalococcoidales bacterium]|nr:PHP domain-containing protein [Dehalococcoidales bacterium]